MKKWLIGLISICLSWTIAAQASNVLVPKEIMEEALKDNNPIVILKDYFIPTLMMDNQAILLFAAEMNLSNGNPKTRDFGERYMFGKLISSNTIMKNLDWATEDISKIEDEIFRLLFGPLENGGQTTFSFGSKPAAKQLVYESGQWIRFRGGPVIRIKHTTEFYGINRYVSLSCDYKNLVGDNYICNFRIVR